MKFLSFFSIVLMAFSLPSHAMPPLDDDAMIERLAACAACHGARGEGAPGGEYYPHLAGKPAGYLFAQMQGFRDGRRHYPQMVYLMQNWDDAWLARIAAFHAAQPMAQLHHIAPPPLDPPRQARAEQLVRQGDASLDLPACASCHGTDGLGTANLPRLAGQYASYIETQLKLFNQRERTNDNAVMHAIVSKMTALEMAAVAVYISGK